MPNFNLRNLRFNWRLLLVQTLANAFALGLTVLLLPGIHMPHDNFITELLASGLIFGLLNGFIRPILQLIMFRFLFLTFGLVLVVINTIILSIMAALTPERFQVDGLLSLLLAGVLVGIFGIFFEALMGVQPPILDNGAVAVTKEHVFSLGSAPIYLPTAILAPEPDTAPQVTATLMPELETAPEAVTLQTTTLQTAALAAPTLEVPKPAENPS